jgi:tetratricopeptide (TPR) repeat protein
MGNLGEAAACYQRALSLYREAGDRFSEGQSLTHVGETCQAVGTLAQAREAWEQALAIFDELRNRDAADKVRAMLASADNRAPTPQPGESGPELPR